MKARESNPKSKAREKQMAEGDLMHFGTFTGYHKKSTCILNAPCEKKKSTYGVRLVFSDGGLEPSVSILEVGEHGGVQWPGLANKTSAIEG